MNRLQIIILSSMAVLLVSILSSQKEKDFRTDYDLRFVCSIKVEINHTTVNTELKSNSDQKELNNLLKKIVCNENLQFKAVKKQSGFTLKNKIFIALPRLEDDYLISQNQTYLFTSRSPPVQAKAL